MKRVFSFFLLLLLAIIIFAAITFFLNRNSGVGALQVTSIPQSRVYLNDKLLGSTPFCKCELPQMIKTGEYAIKLLPVNGNFQPFEEKITINKSTLTVVDRTFGDYGASEGSIISLLPISDKKERELLVVSFPDHSNVFLDNNLIGVTPLLLRSITESDHDLNIAKDGYKDKLVRIRTAPGYKLTALVTLAVSPSLASSSASPQASNSVAPSVQKVVILNTPTGFLRVREGPSLADQQIGEVKPGETFELLEEGNGWLEIKLESGKTGWISATYAEKQ